MEEWLNLVASCDAVVMLQIRQFMGLVVLIFPRCVAKSTATGVIKDSEVKRATGIHPLELLGKARMDGNLRLKMCVSGLLKDVPCQLDVKPDLRK